jgi:hypothetical protein
MDLCRTIIVAALSVLLIQWGERLSYDSVHGLRLAAVPVVTAHG